MKVPLADEAILISESTPDYGAIWSYHQFLINQPRIDTKGLFRVGRRHVIVCPGYRNLKTADGFPLEKWFHDNKVITSPVRLVEVIPDSAEPIPAMSPGDLSRLDHHPLTLRDFEVELNLRLSSLDIEYRVENGAGFVSVLVPKSTSQGNVQRIKEACSSFGIPIHLKLVPDNLPPAEAFRSENSQGDLCLITSRRTRGYLGNVLQQKWEADEDYWLDNREQLFDGTLSRVDEVLPKGFSGPASRCIVNGSVFPIQNLRSYLTIYQEVMLVFPIESSVATFLSSASVDDKDLKEAVSRGRLKILLPQSIDRYSIGLLQAIAEVNPEALLMSRRLAAATMLDSRRRCPILYPAWVWIPS